MAGPSTSRDDNDGSDARRRDSGRANRNPPREQQRQHTKDTRGDGVLFPPPHRRFLSRGNAEAVEDFADVELRAIQGDTEGSSDLGVGLAAGDEFESLRFFG